MSKALFSILCLVGLLVVNTGATEISDCAALITPSKNSRKMIFLVLESGATRGHIVGRLAARELPSLLFSGAEEFLSASREFENAHLIFDSRHARSAILFDFLRKESGDLRKPSIVLINSGDVEMAILAVRSGADEVLEFPFTDAALDVAVDRILELETKAKNGYQNGRRSADRLSGLTVRERQVLQFLFDGYSNKNIANELNISRRTVEVHRASIMNKTKTRSIAALVRLVLDAR